MTREVKFSIRYIELSRKIPSKGTWLHISGIEVVYVEDVYVCFISIPLCFAIAWYTDVDI